MHDERVGAGLHKFSEENVRVGNHEMGFQGQARYLAKRFDDWRAHRNVGHEMAVHHVHVNAVRSTAFSLGHLLAQAGEISGED